MTRMGAGIVGPGVGRQHCEGYAASEDVDFLAAFSMYDWRAPFGMKSDTCLGPSWKRQCGEPICATSS